MIVRTFCDNGYRYDENPENIELNDIEDIVEGSLEKMNSTYNIKNCLTESGKQKIKEYYPNFPFDSNYHGVTVITEDKLKSEEEIKYRHDTVLEANREAHLNHKLAIGEFYGWDNLPITKDILLKHGWHEVEDIVINSLTDEDKKQLESEDIEWNREEYEIVVYNHDHDKYKGYWFLTMRYNMSNTPNRDWACHIDNNLHQTVGYVDIGTIEQFNRLMYTMDIEYRL